MGYNFPVDMVLGRTTRFSCPLLEPRGMTICSSLVWCCITLLTNSSMGFMNLRQALFDPMACMLPKLQMEYPKLLCATGIPTRPDFSRLTVRKARLFDMSGKMLAEVKDLPTGEQLDYPARVAVDPKGNFLVMDTKLEKTFLFDPELNLIGELAEIGKPDSMHFHDNKLYTLNSQDSGSGQADHKVMVYTYEY